jgi:hypothetical protein
MSPLTILQAAELVPVADVEPGRFATGQRPLPSGSGRETPDAWHQYWLESLADSGITGLQPLRLGSWHVPVRQLSDSGTLEKLLDATLQYWGGGKVASDSILSLLPSKYWNHPSRTSAAKTATRLAWSTTRKSSA